MAGLKKFVADPVYILPKEGEGPHRDRRLYLPENSREMKRVRQAQRLLPVLAERAHDLHASDQQAIVAVLTAWAGLAGILGWNEWMVGVAEKELQRVSK